MPTRRVSGVVALVFHPLIEQPGLINNVLPVPASDFLPVDFESHIKIWRRDLRPGWRCRQRHARPARDQEAEKFSEFVDDPLRRFA